MTTKVVIVESGIKLSTFTKKFIERKNLTATIIANSLLDFFVGAPSKESGKPETWVQLELIHLASSIVPDDLTASPLASLFSKSKQINLIPMSPSEQFLGSWFSEIFLKDKNPEDSIRKLFSTLASYHSIPIEVFPITMRNKEIDIKYRNQQGPLRYYHMFGFLDMQKFITIDPNDIQASLNKKDFEITNFEVKSSIISAEVEKIFKEAQVVIIPAGDVISLSVLLSFEDVRKTIKKSNGIVVAIAPFGSKIPLTTDREPVLLEALGIPADISGLSILLKNIADIIVIDQNDANVAQSFRDAGFNVIVEDLLNIEKDEKVLDTILQNAKIDINSIIVKTDNVLDSHKVIEQLAYDVAKVPALAVELSSSVPVASSSVDSTTGHPAGSGSTLQKEEKIIEKTQTTTQKRSQKEVIQKQIGESKPATQKSPEGVGTGSTTDTSKHLQKELTKIDSDKSEITTQGSESLTESANKSEPSIEYEIEPSIPSTTTSSAERAESGIKSAKESIIEAKSGDQTEPTVIVSKDNEKTTQEVATQAKDSQKTQPVSPEKLSDREIADSLIDQLSKEEDLTDVSKFASDLNACISKDANLAIHIGNRILNEVSEARSEGARKFGINVFAYISKDKKLNFRRILHNWLKTALDNQDFGYQKLQAKILQILAEADVDLVGETLSSFLITILTPEILAPARERGKALILEVALQNTNVSKYAIRQYLKLFDDEKVNQGDLWIGLTTFEARLVGIELVEGFSIAKNREISELAIVKGLGSFSVVLNEIVTAFIDFNLDKLLNLCGTLSETALRKAKRLALVQKLAKLGSVPIETFSKSINEDPKEVEALVYEMIMQDEISAKLDIIDGRLYIIKVETETQKQNV